MKSIKLTRTFKNSILPNKMSSTSFEETFVAPEENTANDPSKQCEYIFYPYETTLFRSPLSNLQRTNSVFRNLNRAALINRHKNLLSTLFVIFIFRQLNVNWNFFQTMRPVVMSASAILMQW